jgi:hypothetical protein
MSPLRLRGICPSFLQFLSIILRLDRRRGHNIPPPYSPSRGPMYDYWSHAVSTPDSQYTPHANRLHFASPSTYVYLIVRPTILYISVKALRPSFGVIADRIRVPAR